MDSEQFHRLTKVLVDSGESESVPEAISAFSKYGVRIQLGSRVATEPGQQVIALTAINAAARSFLGNVQVEGHDLVLSARGFEGQTLSEFLSWCEVKHNHTQTDTWPIISIGEDHPPSDAICPWADGWEFGIGAVESLNQTFLPACVAAGGVAVSEAFSRLRKDNPYALDRRLRLSLWAPGKVGVGPIGQDIPAQEDLWFVGLGHLGQAYSWCLGFLQPGDHPLLLQDVDQISKSTLSTSMLSSTADIGLSKARVVAKWLESRGFKTSIVERRFDENCKVQAQEPRTAFLGVDNIAARRVLEGAGFRLAIDAGLGSGYTDFRCIRVRTFPGPSRAADLWSSESEGTQTLAKAYQRLLEDGAEPCGVTTLASRAVGAPFVGCVAAAFVISERIRRQLGGQKLGFIDLNLRDPEKLSAE